MGSISLSRPVQRRPLIPCLSCVITCKRSRGSSCTFLRIFILRFPGGFRSDSRTFYLKVWLWNDRMLTSKSHSSGKMVSWNYTCILRIRWLYDFYFSVGDDPIACLTMLPEKSVKGEITILRFLFRSFGILGYDIDGPGVMKEDNMLDTIHQNLWTTGDVRKAAAQAFCNKMKGGFLGPTAKPNMPSISDFLLYSFIKSTVQKPQVNVAKYLSTCEDFCTKG